ncbi:MAG: peptidase, partial [Eubacterium sp.]|nr:peptidase [Eubacterium sp.]
DREEGILVYEIEFHTATHEYEYEINASTGAVYSKKKEVLPGGGSSSGGSGSTEETDIGIEAAKQIALKVAGGVTIQKAELEQEDGVYVYEIKIRNGEQEYEIKINAQTGEVLEVDVESVHS